MVNLGVSGDTTQDGLARLPMALAEKPAIVLLELGGNDGLRGLPLSVTQSNLAAMIEAFQKSGARVVLAGMTLPPNYGPVFIQKFEAVYSALTKKYGLTLIPFLALLHWGVVLREESYLEAKFGDAYLGYKARVRRWL